MHLWGTQLGVSKVQICTLWECNENDMKKNKEVTRDVPDIRSPPAAAAAGGAGLASPAPADSDPSTQHEGKKV